MSDDRRYIEVVDGRDRLNISLIFAEHRPEGLDEADDGDDVDDPDLLDDEGEYEVCVACGGTYPCDLVLAAEKLDGLREGRRRRLALTPASPDGVGEPKEHGC